MKTTLNRFVEEYKAILNMKKIYHFDDSKINVFKELFLSLTIAVIVFLGIGLLFHMLTSLHYVSIVIDILIVGSFILYKTLIEVQFKLKTGLKYSLIYAMGYEVLYIIGAVMIMNTIVLLFLFSSIVSWILIILVAIIGFISILFCGVYEKEIGYSYENNTRVLFLGIWLALIQILVLYLLPIKIMTLSYFLSAMLTFLLWFGKDITHFSIEFVSNVKSYLYLLLVLFTGIYIFMTISFLETKVSFLEDHANLVNLNLEIDVNDIFTHDNHYYYQDGNILNEYDSNMNLIQEIDPQLGQVLYYYFDNNNLKVLILDSDQGNVSLPEYNSDQLRRVTQYDLSDINQPSMDMNFIYLLDSKIFTYQNNVYWVESNKLNVYLIKLPNEEKINLLNFNQVVVDTKEEAIIYKDGVYMYLFSFDRLNRYRTRTLWYYSNGKTIHFFQENYKNYFTVTTIENYVNNVESYQYKSKYDFNVDGFIAANDLYYIKDTLNQLYVYDEKMNQVAKINNLDNFIMTDNSLITTKYDGSKPYLYIAQLDNLYKVVMNGESRLFDSTALLLMFSLLVFLPLETNLLKRGEGND